MSEYEITDFTLALGRDRNTAYEKYANTFYDGYKNLPFDIKEKLSLYYLREIYKHMVHPVIDKMEQDKCQTTN